MLEVVGGPKDRLPVEDVLEIANARPNPESVLGSRRQCDQSIIDSGVGGRPISQQGDVEGKRAGCQSHGEPVVGAHNLDVDRIRFQSKINVRRERVHRSQAVEAGHHNLGVRVLGLGQVGRKRNRRSTFSTRR